jgi:hypothetical protein
VASSELSSSSSSSQAVYTSSFRLRYSPSVRLVEAEIGVLAAATLSVLQETLLVQDSFDANETTIFFQLQASDTNDTLTFEASTFSETMQQEDWQAFAEATLPLHAGLILNAAVKNAELAFLTSLSIEPVNTTAASPVTSAAKRRDKFTKLDYMLLAATVVLVVIFGYVMYLNCRDWNEHRPPPSIGDEKETTDKYIEGNQPPILLVENADEKELDELMEKIALASEANTSLTISTTSESNNHTLLIDSSTKQQQSEDPDLTSIELYHCVNQSACSLGATLMGLSDIVQHVLRPAPEPDNKAASMVDDNGTMPPRHGTTSSDVSNMEVDNRSPITTSNPADDDWMKQFRISVIESTSFANDSMQKALVTSSSSVCATGNELEGSKRR